MWGKGFLTVARDDLAQELPKLERDINYVERNMWFYVEEPSLSFSISSSSIGGNSINTFQQSSQFVSNAIKRVFNVIDATKELANNKLSDILDPNLTGKEVRIGFIGPEGIDNAD